MQKIHDMFFEAKQSHNAGRWNLFKTGCAIIPPLSPYKGGICAINFTDLKIECAKPEVSLLEAQKVREQMCTLRIKLQRPGGSRSSNGPAV